MSSQLVNNISGVALKKLVLKPVLGVDRPPCSATSCHEKLMISFLGYVRSLKMAVQF